VRVGGYGLVGTALRAAVAYCVRVLLRTLGVR